MGHALALRGVERGAGPGTHDLDRTDDSPEVLRRLHGLWLQLPQVRRGRHQTHLGATPAETLERWRNQQHSKKSPPGPKVTWLGETLIHSEDIRRPLGIHHDYPLDAVTQVLDFYKDSDTLIRAKSRIAGLSLQATDTDWTHGTGPLVEGPAMSLLMAATGRIAALDDLAGDGVAVFRKHWANPD